MNSLVSAGFSGTLACGYRGQRPPWLRQLVQTDDVSFAVTPDLRLVLHEQAVSRHFALHKASFSRHLFDETNADAVFYFDPDIVLTAPWSFYSSWVSCGIAFCEDLESPLPVRHPKRLAWKAHFEKLGWRFPNELTMYANSGFVGVTKGERPFLELWESALHHIAPLLGNQSSIRLADRFHPFCIPDQETFNIALMSYPGSISGIGQEAMGLKTGAAVMAHAVARGDKPWRKNYFRELLSGNPPTFADRSFVRFLDKPVSLSSYLTLTSRPLSQKIASFFSRIYCRKW